MGLADTVTKAYMKENTVFADAFNYLIYGGKAVVDPAHQTAMLFLLRSCKNWTQQK